MNRQRGFSLIEVVVALAVFGVLLLIVTALQAELMRFDRSIRIRYFLHPERVAILARLRTDVLDSSGFPLEHQGWRQTGRTLVLEKRAEGEAPPEFVVWDFTSERLARRVHYRGADKVSEWVANGVPALRVTSLEMPGGRIAVHLQAEDGQGRLVVDQIHQPRAGAR